MPSLAMFRCLPILLLCLALLGLSPLPIAEAQCSTVGGNTPLQVDTPYQGSLTVNSSAFFTVTPPVSGLQLLFTVTPITGAPSLSVSDAVAQPTPSTASYVSTAAAGAVVALNATSSCYYVGVSSGSYTSTSYVLLVQQYDVNAVQSYAVALVDGRPQSDVLVSGEFRYFAFNVTAATQRLQIASTIQVGSPFVVVNGPSSAAPFALPVFPSLTSWQYSSSDSEVDVVLILNPPIGQYVIGIYANQSTVYTLTANTADTIIPMQGGLRYVGTLPIGEAAYYSFYVDPFNVPISLSISLWLLSDWDYTTLAGYCSDTVQRPNATTARWSTVLSATTLRGADVHAGTYWCSVEAIKGDIDYSFSITGGQPTSLDGVGVVEQSSAADQQEVFTYTVLAGQTGQVVITTLAEYGQAYLYTALYPSIASPSTWQKASYTPNSDVQSVAYPLGQYCSLGSYYVIQGSTPPQCRFMIGVYTPVASYYRVLVSQANTPLALLAGQPVTDTLDEAGKAFFSLFIPTELANLTIIVTPQTPALLSLTISRTVSSRSVAWLAQNIDPTQPIQFYIDWTDPKLNVRYQPWTMEGSWAMQVSGPANTSFSISYTLVNSLGNTSVTQLQDGVTAYGTVSDSPLYFSYQPSIEGWPYVVHLDFQRLVGSTSMSYVVTNDTNYRPAPAQGQSVDIFVPLLSGCDPTLNPTCFYLIVVGNRGAALPSQVLLRVAQANAVQYIQGNTGLVLQSADEVLYYYLRSSLEEDPTLVVPLEVQVGVVTVLVSNLTTPNTSTAVWSFSSADNGMLTVPHWWTAQGQYATAYAFFTVQCTGSTDCLYTLSPSFYTYSATDPSVYHSFSLLNTQQFQTTGVNGGDYRYYVTNLKLAFQSVALLQVQTVALIGEVELFINWNDMTYFYNGEWPSANDSMWSSTNPGLNSIDIEQPQLTGGYLITARAVGDQPAMYSIGISTGGAQIKMSNGVPYAGSLFSPSLNTGYFVYNMLGLLRNAVLTVTVTQSTCPAGSLSLFVSDTVQFPSAFLSNWSSVGSLSGVLVTVDNFTSPNALRAPAYYYAAVVLDPSVGSLNCTYTFILNYAVALPLVEDVAVEVSTTTKVAAYASYQLSAGLAAAFVISPLASPEMAYVGVGTLPIAGNVASNLGAATLPGGSKRGQTGSTSSLYIPSSTCPRSVLSAGSCTLTLLLSLIPPAPSQVVSITMMTSLGAILLQPDTTPQLGLTSSMRSSVWQLPLSLNAVQVVVSVSSAVKMTLLCSAAYPKPQLQGGLYDAAGVASQQPAMGQNNGSALWSTQLTFDWTSSAWSPQSPSAAFVIGGAAFTDLYCSVQPASSVGMRMQPFNISWTTQQLPSSEGGGEGTDLTAVAVAVPLTVLAVLAVVAALLWYRRRQGKSSSPRSRDSDNVGSPRNAALQGSGSDWASMGPHSADVQELTGIGHRGNPSNSVSSGRMLGGWQGLSDDQ